MVTYRNKIAISQQRNAGADDSKLLLLMQRLAKQMMKYLHCGESNPGLLRDRREYWPLYYNGSVHVGVL